MEAKERLLDGAVSSGGEVRGSRPNHCSSVLLLSEHRPFRVRAPTRSSDGRWLGERADNCMPHPE